MHALPGHHITGLAVRGQQVLVDQLDRLFGEGVGKGVGFGTNICLDRVSQNIETGIGRNLGRNRAGQRGVQHGVIGQEALVDQRIFDAALPVGDDSKLADLAAGAARRRNGNERAVAQVELAGGEIHDRLGRIDR